MELSLIEDLRREAITSPGDSRQITGYILARWSIVATSALALLISLFSALAIFYFRNSRCNRNFVVRFADSASNLFGTEARPRHNWMRLGKAVVLFVIGLCLIRVLNLAPLFLPSEISKSLKEVRFIYILPIISRGFFLLFMARSLLMMRPEREFDRSIGKKILYLRSFSADYYYTEAKVHSVGFEAILSPSIETSLATAISPWVPMVAINDPRSSE